LFCINHFPSFSCHGPQPSLRQTQHKHPCPPVEFEPTIPVSERPKTHALDRTATGISWDRTLASEMKGLRLTA
jgi:hypothetical protein